jgi:hypothetical protein
VVRRRTLPFLLATALSLAAPRALATGDRSGDLGAAGAATGDISREAGETDRVGITLVAGTPVNIAFKADFAPLLVLTDPEGAALDLGTEVAGGKLKLRGFRAAATGRFELAVSSADGTQGTWSLVVRPAWKRKEKVSGTGDGFAQVQMPAGGFLSAKFRARSTPSLVRMTDPDGREVLGPIPGSGRVVRVPVFAAPLAGTYVLDIHVDDGVSRWSGKIVRRVPKTPAATLDLTNGLTPLRFEADGIELLFSSRCAGCHDFARSYGGVRTYAREAVARMRSGSMPKGGPRIPADQIRLVEMWIETGMQR